MQEIVGIALYCQQYNPGAASGRNQKKLNNRDTNYTNFHELLLGHKEKFKKRSCYA